MAAYRVEFKKSAKKEFDKLPAKVQDQVIEAIDLLSRNPFSELLKIKKLKGAPSLYRVRLGNYRLVYEVQQNASLLIVTKIGNRKEVYRNL